MKKLNFKSVIATALTTVLTLGSIFTATDNINAASYSYPATTTYKSSFATVKGLKIPTTIKQGEVCSISGSVTPKEAYFGCYCGECKYKYTVGIAVYSTDINRNYNRNDLTDGGRAYFGRLNQISYASAESSVIRSYSSTLQAYNLSKLDNYICFNQLPVGEYMYTIYIRSYSAIGSVTNCIREVYTSSFKVYSSTSSFFDSNSYYNTRIMVSDWKTPSQIKRGNSYGLNADINVLYKRYMNTDYSRPDMSGDPKYVRGQITDSNGNVRYDSGKVSLSGTYYFGKNDGVFSVPLPREVDYAMIFGNLPVGSYNYRLTVYYNSGGVNSFSGSTPFRVY